VVAEIARPRTAESAAESLPSEKPLLRKRMRAALAPVSEQQARSAGHRIADALVLTPEWANAPRIALFANLPGEVDTGPIWAAAREAFKTTLFPRIIPGRRRLEFAIVADATDLSPGQFGVLEPLPRCEIMPLDAATLVLVPGLAFDHRGGRLGRGAGYYDRALAGAPAREGDEAQARPCRFGIGFELQIVSSVPMGPHDVRMDAVWTEASQAAGSDAIGESNEAEKTELRRPIRDDGCAD
jgi:5-formyltetrahydrofolate cyclo-ligase